MKRLERPTNITADAGGGAEVLIDHRQRFGISDRLCRYARLHVHRLSEIQISTGLMYYCDDVERLGDCGG